MSPSAWAGAAAAQRVATPQTHAHQRDAAPRPKGFVRRNWGALLVCASLLMFSSLIIAAASVWNGFVGIERLIHIDQQMVVAAVRVAVARVSDPHVAETKAAPKSAFDDGAVLWPYEIQKGIFRRGLPLSVCGEWQQGEG